MNNSSPSQKGDSNESFFSILLIFLRLGLTSFGGPVAHIAYFRDEFVARRNWFSEKAYSEIVAICQFLPGPASSQVGLAIGMSAAGYRGALAAWLGFTLPSAAAITLFAYGINTYSYESVAGIIHGLKIVAVAIIAQAIWGMARTLCPDLIRVGLMVLATLMVNFIPSSLGQIAAILVCALIALATLKLDHNQSNEPLIVKSNKVVGCVFLSLFFVLLVGLPAVSYFFPSQTNTIIASFYKAGSLVFGGGHVVLPLLQAETVTPGYLTNETFLAGYGAAQAVPGPLFTFASFLGASMYGGELGWYGSLIALLAIFLPAFLLVAGVLPFWQSIRNNHHAQKALAGANAGVVGLLIAVLYNPVWSSSVSSYSDIFLVLSAFSCLMFFKLPSWLVVIIFSIIGFALQAF